MHICVVTASFAEEIIISNFFCVCNYLLSRRVQNLSFLLCEYMQYRESHLACLYRTGRKHTLEATVACPSRLLAEG